MKIKQSFINIVFLVVISISAISIFFVVEAKIELGNFGNLLIGGLIGAVITTLITNILLNKQSELEINIDRNAKIFEEKLKVYNRFLDELNGIIEDNSISLSKDSFKEDEIKKLIFNFARIKIHTSSINVKIIIEGINKIINILEDIHKKGIANHSEFYNGLSKELFAIIEIFHTELYGKEFIEKREGDVSDISNIVKSSLKLRQSGIDELRRMVQRRFPKDNWSFLEDKSYSFFSVFPNNKYPKIGFEYFSFTKAIIISLFSRELEHSDIIEKIYTDIAQGSLILHKLNSNNFKIIVSKDKDGNQSGLRLCYSIKVDSFELLRDETFLDDAVYILKTYNDVFVPYFKQ